MVRSSPPLSNPHSSRSRNGPAPSNAAGDQGQDATATRVPCRSPCRRDGRRRPGRRHTPSKKSEGRSEKGDPTELTKLEHAAQRRAARHGELPGAGHAERSPTAVNRFAINENRRQRARAAITFGGQLTFPTDVSRGRLRNAPPHKSPLPKQRPGPGHAPRARKQIHQLITRKKTQEVEHPVAEHRRL